MCACARQVMLLPQTLIADLEEAYNITDHTHDPFADVVGPFEEFVDDAVDEADRDPSNNLAVGELSVQDYVGALREVSMDEVSQAMLSRGLVPSDDAERNIYDLARVLAES